MFILLVQRKNQDEVMTYEVLLSDDKHVAEVYFSLPNSDSEFHWNLFLFFLFPCNLVRSLYWELILPIIFLSLLFDQSFPVCDFQMTLWVLSQVILAIDFQIYRPSEKTAALKVSCVLSEAFLHMKMCCFVLWWDLLFHLFLKTEQHAEMWLAI